MPDKPSALSELEIRQLLHDALRLHREGRIANAESLYRQILLEQPDHADALHLLGIIDLSRGQFESAIQRFTRAILVNSMQAPFHNNLGIALGNVQRNDEAMASFHRAIHLKPDYADAHANVAIILCNRGEIDAAIEAATTAIRFDPNQAEAYINLSFSLSRRGRLDDAITAARHAIRLRPERYEAHNNLATAMFDRGSLHEAIDACREALKLKPDSAEGWNNLAAAQKDLGQIAESLQSYRRAISLSSSAAFQSNLIFAMHFDADCPPAEMARERAVWARLHAEPLKSSILPHGNDPNPTRRLRIGYLSPDFRLHPVGRFFLPLLANHHHENFEIICFSSVTVPDDLSARVKSLADGWVDIRRMTDDQSAGKIRDDKIDILIDLAMHGADNRLPVFARKPAPVQATYLAYPGTTGLDAIDYRISDQILDPPGELPADYTEKTIYLPHSYWCYQPPADAPPVSPLPALSAGYITFGCLNNFCKASPPALVAWREILAAVPNSRLLLHTATGPHREKITSDFAAAGIANDRVSFTPFIRTQEYFQLYGRIDIALDPFPAAGGTTSCDALWMGVPVITLRGKTAIGRGGASILSAVGLTRCIAADVPRYVSLAVDFAQDLPRLAALRSSLRQTMQNSPLMNAAQFAADMETLYRKIWTDWCATRK